MYPPYMTVHLVVSLSKFPYIHRMCMVFANPSTYLYRTLTHGHTHTHTHTQDQKQEPLTPGADLGQGTTTHRSVSFADRPLYPTGVSVPASPFKQAGMHRVGQNHIYTVYTQYFWQGNRQIYGHIRCIYTVLANPRYAFTCLVSRHCQIFATDSETHTYPQIQIYTRNYTHKHARTSAQKHTRTHMHACTRAGKHTSTLA